MSFINRFFKVSRDFSSTSTGLNDKIEQFQDLIKIFKDAKTSKEEWESCIPQYFPLARIKSLEIINKDEKQEEITFKLIFDKECKGVISYTILKKIINTDLNSDIPINIGNSMEITINTKHEEVLNTKTKTTISMPMMSFKGDKITVSLPIFKNIFSLKIKAINIKKAGNCCLLELQVNNVLQNLFNQTSKWSRKIKSMIKGDKEELEEQKEQVLVEADKLKSLFKCIMWDKI